MSKYPGHATSIRPSWPLLGLLVVVLFFVHDALMAVETLAAPHTLMGGRDHATTPLMLLVETSSPFGLGPASGHPENCGVGWLAVVPHGDDVPGAGNVLPILDSLEVLPGISASPGGSFVWAEPHWPPGMLRALCQVYRL
jgi:hypothetical protein